MQKVVDTTERSKAVVEAEELYKRKKGMIRMAEGVGTGLIDATTGIYVHGHKPGKRFVKGLKDAGLGILTTLVGAATTVYGAGEAVVGPLVEEVKCLDVQASGRKAKKQMHVEATKAVNTAYDELAAAYQQAQADAVRYAGSFERGAMDLITQRHTERLNEINAAKGTFLKPGDEARFIRTETRTENRRYGKEMKALDKAYHLITK